MGCSRLARQSALDLNSNQLLTKDNFCSSYQKVASQARNAIADLICFLIQRPFFQINMDISIFLQTLRTLPTQDRLMIAETALKFIWQEQQSLTPMQQKYS